MTILLALVGFLWLPHNAKSAWFLRPSERAWAEERIRRDIDGSTLRGISKGEDIRVQQTEDDTVAEESQGLLGSSSSRTDKPAASKAITDDRGLSRTDIASAVLDWKLWFLLFFNILSSMPVTAFSVFLPIVLSRLTTSPEQANLLTAPPFLVGAVVLYSFTKWSDKKRERMIPLLWGLGLLLLGLTGVVVLPSDWQTTRYISLCVLMSGTFVPSPLIVAWMAGNTPEPGKRSVMLGINGWGNLAGVFSAMLFQPSFAPTYRIPFIVTFVLVLVSFTGFAVFRVLIVYQNEARRKVLSTWTDADVDAERNYGNGPVSQRNHSVILGLIKKIGGGRVTVWVAGWLTSDRRKGDERLTFVYGL